MNSTENVTVSVPPGNDSPELNINTFTGIAAGLSSIIVLVLVTLSFVFCHRLNRYKRRLVIAEEIATTNVRRTQKQDNRYITKSETVLTETDDGLNVNDGITDSTEDLYDTINLTDVTENPYSGTILNRITNEIEDLSTAKYVKNESPATAYSQHEVVIQMLPKDNNNTDKTETCNKIVNNKLLPSENVKRVTDEQTTEWCLSECKINSADSPHSIANKQKEFIYDIPSTVIPLKSPTGNSDENIDETLPKSLVKSKDLNVENNLDWNKVFLFLANHLDAGKWILFFNTLYDNTSSRRSMNVAAKLKQVEHDTKQRVGGETVTLLMEQFKAWKEFSGRNAKHIVICRSLQDLDMNDTLEKFEEYMRNPPVLPAYDPEESCVTGNQSPVLHNSISSSLQSLTYFIPSLTESTNTTGRNHTNDYSLPRDTTLLPKYGKVTKRVCEVSYEVENELVSTKSNKEERDEPDGVSGQTISSLDQTNLKSIVHENQVPSGNAEHCIKTKEITETVRNPSSQKIAKLSSSNVKKRRKSYCQTKRKKKTSSKLSKISFQTMAECLLQNTTLCLPKDMYQILLQKTVSTIVKETKVSENEVLSLTCEEYHEAEEFKTKKETLFVMYSRDHSRLILGVSAFKNLQLFTDKARQQIIDRVGPNIGQENQKYLFIDYDGKRILSQADYFSNSWLNAKDISDIKMNNAHLEDETRSDDSSGINIESTSASSDDD